MKRPDVASLVPRSSLQGRAAIRVFVWALLAGLVLMNGLAVLSVSHAVQHHSHDSAAHHAGLCAWYCAAGQAVESAIVQIDARIRTIVPVDARKVDEFTAALPLHTWFRGPPLFLA